MIMKEGKLIVLEGACDGIGKTTQFNVLRDHLERDGIKVHHHHFPSYNTFHGVPVERYLAGDFGEPSSLSPYFINCLYAEDRAVAWYTDLKQHFNDGEFILLDRYTTSSLIYQSALIEDLEERKKFIDYVIDFEYNKLGIKTPDNVIFLYAPFDLIAEMRKTRKQSDGIQNDIHERNLDFMKKVYDNAMFIADYLKWSKIKCNKGKKMRSIEEIHEDIYKIISKSGNK